MTGVYNVHAYLTSLRVSLWPDSTVVPRAKPHLGIARLHREQSLTRPQEMTKELKAPGERGTNKSSFASNYTAQGSNTMKDAQIEAAIKTQEAQTARLLALALSSALGMTVVLQYTVLTVLACRGSEKEIPVFEHLFNAWLPVISGLTGSAVTYYLTKRPQLLPAKAVSRRGSSMTK
jgi:hypothetical protein